MKHNILLSLSLHTFLLCVISVYYIFFSSNLKPQVKETKYNIKLVGVSRINTAQPNNLQAEVVLNKPELLVKQANPIVQQKPKTPNQPKTDTMVKANNQIKAQPKPTSPIIANDSTQPSFIEQILLNQQEDLSIKEEEAIVVTDNVVNNELIIESNTDNTLSDEVKKYIAKSMDNTILYNENYLTDLGITDGELLALQNHLSGCGYRVNFILDEDIELTLKLEMNPDASIFYVKIISYKTKSKAPKEKIDKILGDTLDVFKTGSCSSLPLPLDKFNKWSNFEFKLNIKGFFNNEI